MSDERVYVVAMDSYQAKDYIRVMSDKDRSFYDRARIVWRADILFGTRNAEVHLIGWYERHQNWRDIQREISYRQCNVTVVEDWR